MAMMATPFLPLFQRPRWPRWQQLLAALLLLGICGLGWPQPPAHSAPPSLRFKKLGPLDNDEPSMLSLLQDRQGFVWIGTHSNGLYRYDGYRAVKFAHARNDARSLPHDRVAAIYEDRRGRLWAGTANGLARYNPDSNDFTVFAPPSGPANRLIVKNIISDGKDGMWVGTWGGLQHFNPDSGKFTVYAHDAARPGSLGSNDLNALALDKDGGLWAGTWPGGVDYLAPGATLFQHYRVDSAAQPDSRSNIVRAMQFDRDGTLWLGTEAGVLSQPAGQPWAPRRPAASPSSRITSFYVDQAQTLWATTLSAGLLRWNPDKASFDQYQHQASDPYSLPGNNLRAMLQDRGGMLWVASFTDGISLANLNSRGFRRHVPHRLDQGSLSTNALLALAAAPDGKVWLAANLGLSLYDPASGAVLQSYRSADGKPGTLSHDIVYSLYQDLGQGKDAAGPLWAGTANGLNRLGPDGRFQVIRFGNTASDYINAIAPGRDHVLWLATGNSLVRYDSKRGSHHIYYNDPADPASRSVNGTSAVLEDRAGRVWAGSEWNGGGLDMLDPATGKFRHLRHAPDASKDGGQPSLSDDNVSSLHEDAAGRLWVGTAKGLDLVTVAASGALRVQPYAAAVGSGKVLAIRSDQDGMIWASTIAGLYRLDPASGKVERYSPADGLTDGYTTNSSANGSDGTLYFGGVHGMTAVTPRSVRSDTVAPQVAITDITVFNRSLGEGQRSEGAELQGPVTAPRVLTLSAQASVFSIEFAALHYTDPGQNRYAYQLAGFDRDWVLADASHRNASYTNLYPGTYTFRVRAANHRGVWSAEPASMTIVITPPFWQRWWFRAGLGLLVLGGLLAAHRWRIRRLTRRQAELAALVTARTAALEESNRKLAALSTTDGLTGVRNRRGFDEALAAEWRRAARTGQTVALSLLDVDHFKKYNDHYGHLAGDTCLRTVAELITKHGRRSTDLVARYGGEEFALLAAATNAADAFGVAQDICAELARLALPHADAPLGIVTISIGVAVLAPTDDNTEEMLVALADQALYRAKEKGRNQALLALGME
ncbi:ligand-binding sensor domain-containing diguanylate cyclase [Pseudoduganella aquatica]|uniref:ligand-binding sensor domain-containing diguanylate cyclase n=1 Tax=Pseudoduganella aquatica TaxID=2660641 RepID=UPI001E2B53A9|nr:diguanylate cyclase [Pseudoduganella aquatica]